MRSSVNIDSVLLNILTCMFVCVWVFLCVCLFFILFGFCGCFFFHRKICILFHYMRAISNTRLHLQKPKRSTAKSTGKKKPKNKKGKLKQGKKTKVSSKVANGSAKEDVALMDNAGFEDTEMTEIKIEMPGNDEVLTMSKWQLSVSVSQHLACRFSLHGPLCHLILSHFTLLCYILSFPELSSYSFRPEYKMKVHKLFLQ